MTLDCYGSSYTLPSNSYLSKELVLPLAKSCTAWQFLAFEMAASWPWPSGCNPKRSHIDTHLKRRGLWRPYKETSLQINLNATCQQDICFTLTPSFLSVYSPLPLNYCGVLCETEFQDARYCSDSSAIYSSDPAALAGESPWVME